MQRVQPGEAEVVHRKHGCLATTIATPPLAARSHIHMQNFQNAATLRADGYARAFPLKRPTCYRAHGRWMPALPKGQPNPQ